MNLAQHGTFVTRFQILEIHECAFIVFDKILKMSIVVEPNV